MDSASSMPPIPEPTTLTRKERWLKRMRNPKMLGAALLLGVLGFFLARILLKPQRGLRQKAFATGHDVFELYRMQIRYKMKNGTYANDLDTLLSIAPDAAAFKARMGEHLDLTTLAIVGDVKRFEVEANVLDPDRTLVKIRGPIPVYPSVRKEPAPMQLEAPATKDGAPLAPPAPAPAPGR